MKVVDETHRMMISITKSLRKRMDAVKDQVNWSAVARDAFERKLRDIARAKEIDMSDGLQRLRATKESFILEEIEAGKEAGVLWAKDSADYKNLELLHRSTQQYQDYSSWAEDFDSRHGPVDHFYSVTGLDDDLGSTREQADYTEAWFGTQNPSTSFIAGFVEGALEVFSKI